MPYSIYAFLADALLALILLLGIGLGWRRGFIRTVAKPVKLVFLVYSNGVFTLHEYCRMNIPIMHRHSSRQNRSRTGL